MDPTILLLLILFGLGLFGLALTSYMTAIFLRVQRGERVRCLDEACPIVMKTPYAQSLGFPNSYLAIPFYGLLVLLSGLRLMGWAAWLTGPVAIASGIALAMSLYLTYALVVKLDRL